MNAPRSFLLTILLACLAFAPVTASGAVVVIANRAADEVRFTLTPPSGKVESHRVSSGDLLALSVVDSVVLSIEGSDRPARFQVDPNAAYFFADKRGRVEFEQIGLGTHRAPVDLARHEPPVAKLPIANSGTDKPGITVDKQGLVTIPVKILTDDDQPAVRKVWEEQLRSRVKAASDILERQCRLRFEVVAVETWDTDDTLVRFEDSLVEFEREVSSAPGSVAIGFASQYALPPKTRTNLGGTRGPFYSHVLIREWSQHISEPERLEVLLHELAHELGATHSPESNSTMRPMLGDRQARAKKFRVGLDPVNALVVNLVVEEIRQRGVSSFTQLSRGTREQLVDIYTSVAATLPDDPAAKQYLAFLRGTPIRAESPPPLAAQDQAEAVRHILAAIVRAAEANARRPEPGATSNPSAARLTDDKLTAEYVRRAAETARRLPAEQARGAFLIGLGISLDRSGLLQENVVIRELYRRIESEKERSHRLAVLGQPTVRGREDLLSHFVVSAALTELVGAKLAETAGIIKEANDAAGDSGFSFVDLAADLAGIAFAERAIGRKESLDELATTFAVPDYMPEIAGLRENLSSADFTRDYGGTTDARFRAELDAIRKRVADLPIHAPPAKP